MIRTLYGTFGAATGITQGLIRGTFKSLQVPATPLPGADIIKNRATELIADCAIRDKPATATPLVLLPILIVGHSRVGKTTFVDTYLYGQCLQPPEPTLGADLLVKQLFVQQQFVALQVWDTAGEKQADLLDSFFWSNASGAIIVCNLAQTHCVCTLDFWQDKLRQDCVNLPIVVVGVKHEQGSGQAAYPENCQQEELHVVQWCKHNHSCLFLVIDQSDQQSAEAAITALVDMAMQYQEQKSKLAMKPFTADTYPALFMAQGLIQL